MKLFILFGLVFVGVFAFLHQSVQYGGSGRERMDVWREALEGKETVVTGASTGIGEQVAYLLCEARAKTVYLVSRRLSVLEKVAEECRARSQGATEAVAVAADLGDAEQVAALCERLPSSLDVLVLNHIIGFFEPWSKVAESWGVASEREVAETVLRINTLGYIDMATRLLPNLSGDKFDENAQQPSDGKTTAGSIVVVSSLAGHVGVPYASAYSASKHALHGFFGSFRSELALLSDQQTPSISVVALGNIDTANARANTAGKLSEELERHSARAAASSILNAVVDRGSHYFFPFWELRLVTLLHSFAPDLVDRVLRFAMLKP